ncbi:MAG: WG repeat-containing protein [Bacteroidota bacterium]
MGRPKSNVSQIVLAICAVITLIILIVNSLYQDRSSASGTVSGSVSYDTPEAVQDEDSSSDFELCLSKVLESQSNYLPYCFSEKVRNKELDYASRLLSNAKESTVDKRKIDFYNSKLNDLDIIRKLDVDDAVGEYNDLVTVISRGDSYGLAKKDGTILFDCIFDDVDPQVFKPLIMIGENKMKGFVDGYGNVVHSPRFDQVDPQYGEPLIAFKNTDGWGFMDSLGNILVEPVYDSLLYVNEGRIGVLKGGRYGFINNKNGNVEVPIIYSEVEIFVDGRSKVRLNDKEYVIDRQGQKINE